MKFIPRIYKLEDHQIETLEENLNEHMELKNVQLYFTP